MFRGRLSSPCSARRSSTLVAEREAQVSQPAFQIALRGPDQTLTVVVSPEPGRSSGYWHGPRTARGGTFDFQIMVHTDMGPGGLLVRSGEGGSWSSLRSSSA